MENMKITSEPNVGMFNRESMTRISKIKDYIQKAIIWTLVGGVALGAFLILFAGSGAGEILGKFVGTLFILAAAAIISFVEFNVIEKGNPAAQKLAVFGVALNVLWTLLWTLVTWGIIDMIDRNCRSGYGISYYCSGGLSFLGKLTTASTSLSGLGLFGSIILNLYEGKKRSTIRPLKITSFACLVYAELHTTIRILALGSSSSSSYSSTDDLMTRFDILAAFVAIAWFITFLIAAVLSKHETNAIEYAKKMEKDEEQRKVLEQAATNVSTQSHAPKTDEELRAEIEEKVRREMIEKEVRAKLEKEMAEKKSN